MIAGYAGGGGGGGVGGGEQYITTKLMNAKKRDDKFGSRLSIIEPFNCYNFNLQVADDNTMRHIYLLTMSATLW